MASTWRYSANVRLEQNNPPPLVHIENKVEFALYVLADDETQALALVQAKVQPLLDVGWSVTQVNLVRRGVSVVKS